jgi:hypothetical protein
LDLSKFEHVGLYDPNSPDAEQRRELLEYLVAHGASISPSQRSRSAPSSLQTQSAGCGARSA